MNSMNQINNPITIAKMKLIQIIQKMRSIKTNIIITVMAIILLMIIIKSLIIN